MSLTKAIDRAVEYVQAHPDQMTRNDVDEFHRLADEVYLLAFRAELVGALPHVPELRPQLESELPPLPPVQFESKLNLPGDWDFASPLDQDGLPPVQPLCSDDTTDDDPTQRVFLVCASPRWLHDMGVLRVLAESEPEAESGGQASIEQHMERLAQAVGDENAAKIISIAHRKNQSGEQKMLEILQSDKRYGGKDSVAWGTLLGVSPAAVRGYRTWKTIQQFRKRAD